MTGTEPAHKMVRSCSTTASATDESFREKQEGLPSDISMYHVSKATVGEVRCDQIRLRGIRESEETGKIQEVSSRNAR